MEKARPVLLCCLLILSFIICGCSTFSIKNYRSREKFIEDINKSIKSGEINIILKSDSVKTLSDGGKIINDTLFASDILIPINQINKISYRGHIGGLFVGMASGFITGVITGVAIGSKFPNTQEGSDHASTYYFITPIVGTALGTLIGGVLGWKTTYKLDF